ncbi:DJ-1/PfpI family protein [Halorussus aquaticus]|uniref:DJ-1/PfpI family protein n=1 Tax=Halorussus aquaticus TaxID=2953748 RepID=A0ABD5Q2A3_9EURY|nr:DJ-1/PfpI family protein [Halorussus aquaticus]
MTTDIAVVVYEGFDEMDAIAPYEVFSHASDRGCDLDVSVRTLDSADRVTASHGLGVEVDGRLADADPDLVVVPGGGWNDRADASAWAEAQRGDLPRALADLHEDGVGLAAVCTGGMLLAEAGVLDDRPAVTHASALDDLRETDAEVVDARVVDASRGTLSSSATPSDDGDVLTAGVTSGLDLALYLVARICGEEVAEQVATEIEYEPREDVYVAREE